MKNNINLYIRLSIVFTALFVLVSCDEGGDPDPGATNVVKMSGDWYVRIFNSNGDDLAGFYLLSTYNTAENNNEIWIDDHEIWPMKVTGEANTESLTFSGSALENNYFYVNQQKDTIYPSVDILEGKVLLESATTTGGNVSDSIYLSLEFSDDPGNVYSVAGYRRTGFIEDEH